MKGAPKPSEGIDQMYAWPGCTRVCEGKHVVRHTVELDFDASADTV